MYDICFIILNYNLHEETMACVSSIREHIDTKRYFIIIVDNASQNGSGIYLKNKCLADRDIEFIQISENVGFAKGNNVGIRRARELGSKFICCINDDAKLITDNFYSCVKDKYQLLHPALIGPQIIKPDGSVDEYYHEFRSLAEYERILYDLENETLEDYKAKYQIGFKQRLREYVDRYKITRYLFRTIKQAVFGIDPYYKKQPAYSTDTLDIVMLGCCFVFTPTFFENLEGFDERTFLYCEEELLYAQLRVCNMHTLYTPEISIYHKGGVSTGKLVGDRLEKKWAFRVKQNAESLRLLIAFIKEHQDEIYTYG